MSFMSDKKSRFKVLLARHGRSHAINPSNVNYRANIHALKVLECTHVIATTATGSLKAEIKPGDIVILDDFIDRTKSRVCTFYDGSETSGVGVSRISGSIVDLQLNHTLLHSRSATSLRVPLSTNAQDKSSLRPQRKLASTCTSRAQPCPSRAPGSAQRPSRSCSSRGTAIWST